MFLSFTRCGVKHCLPYEVRQYYFENEEAVIEWIIKNQLGRRNLTNEQKAYLIGLQYEGEKKKVGRHENNNEDKMSPLRTAEKIAEQNNINQKTVKRNATYSKAIDVIAETAGQELEFLILQNLYRDVKTTEQKAREYTVIKAVEAEKAKMRMTAGINQYSPTENFPYPSNKGEARQKAAENFKESYKTLETAEKIVSIADSKPDEQRQVILGVLNNVSTNAAKEAAKAVANKEIKPKSKRFNYTYHNNILGMWFFFYSTKTHIPLKHTKQHL